MTKLKKYRISVAILASILLLGVVFSSHVEKFILSTSDLLATVLPSTLVELANSRRLSLNMKSLKINPDLERAAQMKADHMAANGYFAHYSPTGESPWYWMIESGYDFVYAGENLAVNFDESEAVNTAWMNSPTHRANILSAKFTEVGTAVSRGTYKGREATFVVQMFGAPGIESILVENLVTKGGLDPAIPLVIQNAPSN